MISNSTVLIGSCEVRDKKNCAYSSIGPFAFMGVPASVSEAVLHLSETSMKN